MAKEFYEISSEDADMISKFAEETADKVSKLANEVTAYSMDASSVTVTQEFTKMVQLVKPLLFLEKLGIVTVKEVADNTDKATFSVALQQGFTWNKIDERGSEVVSLAAGSGSYQSINAPAYVQVSPYTNTTTISLFDNIRLDNPVDEGILMAQVQEEIAYAKEADAYSTLATAASYTASVSMKFAGGYSSASGYITSANVLTFDDLDDAKKDLMTQNNASSATRKIVPDTVLIALNQKISLEDSAILAPGQSTSGQYRKAQFDNRGNLVAYAEMDIIMAVNMPQVTTGYFASQNGHYCYVGKKNMFVGRAEDTKRNKARMFEDYEAHCRKLTIDINYAHGLLFNKGLRLLACYDE